MSSSSFKNLPLLNLLHKCSCKKKYQKIPQNTTQTLEHWRELDIYWICISSIRTAKLHCVLKYLPLKESKVRHTPIWEKISAIFCDWLPFLKVMHNTHVYLSSIGTRVAPFFVQNARKFTLLIFLFILTVNPFYKSNLQCLSNSQSMKGETIQFVLLYIIY